MEKAIAISHAPTAEVPNPVDVGIINRGQSARTIAALTPLVSDSSKGGSVAEVTRRRRGELMRGVFRILLDEADGLRKEIVLERLAREVPPTPFEASEYPNRPGVRRYEKVVQFSTIGPTKAGWLIKDRGLWTLSNEGRHAYERRSMTPRTS